MCGRYGLSLPSRVRELPLDSALLAEFEDVAPRWNITPSQSVLAVVSDRDGIRTARLRWGLIPSWAKDASIGQRMANARSETVRSKPSFRKPFASRRALVFADLYYEWQVLESQQGKQPWCIRLADNAPFAFAALWDVYSPPAPDDAIATFTLLTTAANPLVSAIHDRMPVLLAPAQYHSWLNLDTPLDDVETIVHTPPALDMHAYRVSTYVNSPAHDDAQCAEPIDPSEAVLPE